MTRVENVVARVLLGPPAMRKLSALVLATAALLALHRPARAQGNEPPATPPATAAPQASAPQPAAPVRDGASQWRYDYGVARERLLAGDFTDAAERFETLTHDLQAPPADRALAAAMLDLARSWSDRGLALVKRNDLGESNLPARAVNERTTDEIAQLYAASIFYGIGTGAWIDAHTQASSAAGVILPMVIASGVAAGSVALLDIGHPLHYGVAQSTVSGLYLGFEEGLLLSLWNQSLSDGNSHWQGSTVADVIWAFSTVGAVGGGLLGTSLGTTPGRASFVGSTGLWAGVLTGFTAAAFTSSKTDPGSNALLAANVGLGAGALAGLLAAGPVSPSIARVRFLDIGGLAGGLVAGGLYVAAANNKGNTQAGLGVTAIGAAGGLTVAWLATGKMPADRPEDRTKAGLLLEPTLAPVQGGATIGVMGAL